MAIAVPIPVWVEILLPAKFWKHNSIKRHGHYWSKVLCIISTIHDTGFFFFERGGWSLSLFLTQVNILHDTLTMVGRVYEARVQLDVIS